MTALTTRVFLAVFLIVGVFAGAAQSQQAAGDISESAIVSLQKELAEASGASSSARVRRAYKGVVRDGEKLLKSSPAAPNRYRVLDLVFQSQKRLLAQENSVSNRDALLETCARLAEAPDHVADLRLEADLLLSERALSSRNADVNERAEALQELIGRYRGTPGEAKSLMLASQIAPKLEAFELEMQILRTMQERFADHHGVIEFRRKSLAAGRIEALFRGTFTRADGTSLNFPADRLGHPCLMVFWTKKTGGFDVALNQINEYEELHPGRFDLQLQSGRVAGRGRVDASRARTKVDAAATSRWKKQPDFPHLWPAGADQHPGQCLRIYSTDAYRELRARPRGKSESLQVRRC